MYLFTGLGDVSPAPVPQIAPVLSPFPGSLLPADWQSFPLGPKIMGLQLTPSAPLLWAAAAVGVAFLVFRGGG